MDQIVIGIFVFIAALFIVRKVCGSIRSAKMDGGSCCGSCGCKAGEKPAARDGL